MKRIIAVLLAGCLTFGVAACGQQTNTNEDEAIKQEEVQENTNKEEQQNDEATKTDETEELAEFDITGDEFIDIMNKLIEGSTHSDLVLTDFKTTEVAKGNRTMYYATNNDIFVSCTINNDTNNVYLFDVTIKTDALNEDTYANVLFYFMAAMSTLHLEEEPNDLLENLNMADYTSKNNEFYPTDEANYAKIFSNDDFTFTIQATNNNE